MVVAGHRVCTMWYREGKQMEKYTTEDSLRRAAERLLVWGFSPVAIAKQLSCSVAWVRSVQDSQPPERPLGDRLPGTDLFSSAPEF